MDDEILDSIMFLGIAGGVAIFILGGGLGKGGFHLGGIGGGHGGHGHGGGGKEKEEYEHKGGHGYLGTPGFYTSKGHHHCKKGTAGCVCTDPHKCTVGAHLAFYDGGTMYSY